MHTYMHMYLHIPYMYRQIHSCTLIMHTDIHIHARIYALINTKNILTHVHTYNIYGHINTCTYKNIHICKHPFIPISKLTLYKYIQHTDIHAR